MKLDQLRAIAEEAEPGVFLTTFSPQTVIAMLDWIDRLPEEIYETIKHGDEQHRKWLHDKLHEFFARAALEKP